MTDAERNRIEEVIEGMGDEEKAVVVRCIPTDILQGEITRRLNRDKEQQRVMINLVNSMERH